MNSLIFAQKAWEQVFTELKKTGKVKNKADLMLKLGYPAQHYSKFAKGIVQIPYNDKSFRDKLIELGVNPDCFSNPDIPIWLPGKNTNDIETINDKHSAKMKRLEAELEELKAENEALERLLEERGIQLTLKDKLLDAKDKAIATFEALVETLRDRK